ncbi:hypothetical protein Tco_0365528 [Tanacetum coccineum]
MVKMVPYEAFACRCRAGDVVLRESYKPKPVVNYIMHVHYQSFPGASSNPSYSPGPSTPPSYSPGPSTPQSYSLGPSRNAECLNCKHLLGKITAEDFIFFFPDHGWRIALETDTLNIGRIIMISTIISKLGRIIQSAQGHLLLLGNDQTREKDIARMNTVGLITNVKPAGDDIPDSAAAEKANQKRKGKQAAVADHFRIPVFAPQYEDETETDPKAEAMFDAMRKEGIKAGYKGAFYTWLEVLAKDLATLRMPFSASENSC